MFPSFDFEAALAYLKLLRRPWLYARLGFLLDRHAEKFSSAVKYATDCRVNFRAASLISPTNDPGTAGFPPGNPWCPKLFLPSARIQCAHEESLQNRECPSACAEASSHRLGLAIPRTSEHLVRTRSGEDPHRIPGRPSPNRPELRLSVTTRDIGLEVGESR